MAIVYDSLSSSSLCGARLVASLSVLETLSTLILSAPRLLTLAVLLALSSCLLTVLLGLTLCLLGGYSLKQVGGVLGVGTIITAFFMGPLIGFFNRRAAEPFLRGRGA